MTQSCDDILIVVWYNFSQAPGVREKAITCPNDNKLCENGKARIKLPGKCCKVCSKYLCYWQIKERVKFREL